MRKLTLGKNEAVSGSDLPSSGQGAFGGVTLVVDLELGGSVTLWTLKRYVNCIAKRIKG